jgi:hypothetical protein
VEKIITGLSYQEADGVRSRSTGLGYRKPPSSGNGKQEEGERSKDKGDGGGAPPNIRRQHQFKPDYCGHLYLWACVLVVAASSGKRQVGSAVASADTEDNEVEVNADELKTITLGAFKAGYNHSLIFETHGNAPNFAPAYGVNSVADFGFGPSAVKWNQSCTHPPEEHALANDALATLSERHPEWKEFQTGRLKELHGIFSFVLPDTGPA